MKDSTAITIRLLFALLTAIGFAVVLVGLAFPSATLAAEVSVYTAQLLPPGTNTSCPQLPVSGFTPYIYNGALHAFEFSVPDSSYVAIAGTAGNTSIPFSQMTRRIVPSGDLRIHADVPSTPILGRLVVNVTMLSSKSPSSPVCISVVLTAVNEEGQLEAVPTVMPTPSPTPAPTTGGISQPRPSPAPRAGVTPPSPTTTAGEGAEATSAPLATAQNILKDMCAGGGALRLWLILLVAYALIVIGAIVGQPKMPASMRTQEWVAAIIVVPFLLLFGLWYFVESCRTSAWIPVIATVIALAGLSAAFWERKGATVINLPEAKK